MIRSSGLLFVLANAFRESVEGQGLRTSARQDQPSVDQAEQYRRRSSGPFGSARITAFLRMDGFEHVAHLADLGRRADGLEDVPIKMHHAALPLGFRQVLRWHLDQAEQHRDDQLHSLQPPSTSCSREMPTSRICPPRRPRRCPEFPESLAIDGNGHEQRDIMHLAGPTPLHHDAVEREIRVLALDATLTRSLDPRRRSASGRTPCSGSPGAPSASVTSSSAPHRDARQIHLDQRFLD